ncbi:MAG: hypothetical protein COA73_07060 [Candidatus Hydrogenedentota bacterium]|nr:MAG: hypothetical protein COA73_07060 [Candidatus Hydrogenedentota bacterium]
MVSFSIPDTGFVFYGELPFSEILMYTSSDLASLAEEAVDKQGEHTALVYDGTPVSNMRVLRDARKIQCSLLELGMDDEGIAVVCMKNHPLVHSVFLGGFRAGVTITPVIPQLTAHELRFIFEHTRCRCVFTDGDKIETVREAAAGLDHIQWIAVLNGTDDADAVPREYGLDTLLESGESHDFVTPNPDNVALMLYTSGTTGKPKGVMLSHANLIASGETLIDAAELHLRDHPIRSITALPMAHIFGISLMTFDFLVPTEYEPGYMVQEAKFDAEHIMRLIEEHGCTDLSVVPTMLSLMLNHPSFEKYDLSSLFKVDVGGAPMAEDLARQFKAQVGCHIRQRYGMTENSGKGSTDRTSEPYHPGSVGRQYHNTDVKIVIENGEEQEAGEIGEIATRGPTTMLGYYRDAKATAETLRDGWLHTGDLGYMSEDGWLYVVDRKKDMIIKGGENIYPAELESVLYKMPGVADAAVVGVPHPIYGEVPVAYVVARHDGDIDVESILAHLKKAVTSFKIPSKIAMIEQLPKSGVGKVLRRELRERARETFTFEHIQT